MSARIAKEGAPPNRRPSPEAVAARLKEAELEHKRGERKHAPPRPFMGPHDVRRKEAAWLMKKRGLPSERIKTLLDDISRSIGFGDANRLGEYLKLRGAEKDAFRIRQIRPIDRTREDQKRINQARKNDRKRAKRKVITPMSADELQSGAILGALDETTWRSARDLDAVLAECPAFGKVTSRASRKAIIRRAFGKLAAFDLIEVEDQMTANGLAVYARRLPSRNVVH